MPQQLDLAMIRELIRGNQGGPGVVVRAWLCNLCRDPWQGLLEEKSLWSSWLQPQWQPPSNINYIPSSSSLKQCRYIAISTGVIASLCTSNSGQVASNSFQPADTGQCKNCYHIPQLPLCTRVEQEEGGAKQCDNHPPAVMHALSWTSHTHAFKHHLWCM